MEPAFAQILVPWIGWGIAFLMGILNWLLWRRITDMEEKIKILTDGENEILEKVSIFKQEYLEKHGEIKDLEIKMGQMENRIIGKIAEVQAHMATVAAHLALKEQRDV